MHIWTGRQNNISLSAPGGGEGWREVEDSREVPATTSPSHACGEGPSLSPRKGGEEFLTRLASCVHTPARERGPAQGDLRLADRPRFRVWERSPVRGVMPAHPDDRHVWTFPGKQGRMWLGQSCIRPFTARGRAGQDGVSVAACAWFIPADWNVQ